MGGTGGSGDPGSGTAVDFTLGSWKGDKITNSCDSGAYCFAAKAARAYSRNVIRNLAKKQLTKI
jgi:hypothetical protein